jgi:hypothetical protein
MFVGNAHPTKLNLHLLLVTFTIRLPFKIFFCCESSLSIALGSSFAIVLTNLFIDLSQAATFFNIAKIKVFIFYAYIFFCKNKQNKKVHIMKILIALF